MTDTYGWWGWAEETDLDNADDRPDVWFLTITEDGEEMAVIMHRTCDGKYPITGDVANAKIERAQKIVTALNLYDKHIYVALEEKDG